MNFTAEQRRVLLNTAHAAIDHGLNQAKHLPIQLHDYDEQLQQQQASFVTLEINDQLRGCMGSLSAIRPLIADVAHNAFMAAFHDPRFYALKNSERALLQIAISVLSVPEDLSVTDEADLLQQLRPHIDGLILHMGSHSATFLPAVWQSLSNPQDFLNQLKRKAGLPADYWSRKLQFQRYTTQLIE